MPTYTARMMVGGIEVEPAKVMIEMSPYMPSTLIGSAHYPYSPADGPSQTGEWVGLNKSSEEAFRTIDEVIAALAGLGVTVLDMVSPEPKIII